MNGFKLLAIRPLEGCNENFRKRLKDGTIYKFYQDYKFLDREKKEISPKNNNMNEPVHSVAPPKELKLYTKKNSLKINVSAVVGKNGSGKSTLFELFFLVVFLKSAKSNLLDLEGEILKTEERIKLLETDIDINKKNIASKEQERINLLEENKNGLKKNEIEQILNDMFSLNVSNKDLEQQLYWETHHINSVKDAQNFTNENSIAVEVYFEINGKVSRISVTNNNSSFNDSSLIDEFELTKGNIEDFFYSISLNYSLYGLNAKYLGKWIERLFHKNDEYQTPIVINPMRTNGDIDINKENNLAQSRILTNLVDSKLRQKEIVKGKVIDLIQFSIPSKKIEENKYYISRGTKLFDLGIVQKELKFVKVPVGYVDYQDLPSNENILDYFGIKEISISLGDLDVELIKKYISQKLFKIARTYNGYRKYLQNYDSSKQVISDIEKFISDILADSTHKTLKLRQLVNVLKYGVLSSKDSQEMELIYELNDGTALKWENGKFRLKFSDYALIINKAYQRALDFHNKQPRDKRSRKPELIEFVPNAFFVPEVRFKGEGRFESLSSGEQQYYNAINTIVYHILNLDTIDNHYSRVNIMFDEVELYFHPEFQRRFISDLLRSLNNLKLDKIKEVNISFSTHSPFILSDVPSSNILRLVDGVPQDQSNETFAANIYDLLNDDFFLTDGVIGEFAKQKIKTILNKSVILEEDIKILELIGDPLLKSVVIDQANAKIKNDDLINRQIEKLKEQLKNK